MPVYITLMKFTEQGFKDVKSAPGRLQTDFKVWELVGGKMLGSYFVMGEYDYVAITESPSDEAAISSNLAVCTHAHVKTSTLRAFSIAEFAKVVGHLP